jgi:hypothetical protein
MLSAPHPRHAKHNLTNYPVEMSFSSHFAAHHEWDERLELIVSKAVIAELVIAETEDNP